MVSLPRTAYVLLWFPKPSETFIFREVRDLRDAGLPVKVFTLYGEWTRGGLSREMRTAAGDIERLGLPFLASAWRDVAYWWRRDRSRTAALLRGVPWRRWNGLEKTGENLWAFLSAFRLARRCEEARVEHIHAPWASGPATAAWVASRLTGIPFSFTGRAWDIYPPDGALREKLRDASVVRCETRANLGYLAGFCDGEVSKLHVTYNGLPLESCREAPAPMQPPFKLLAVGRFVGKKGYPVLLRACRLLADDGVDFRLTLAGAGPRALQLRALTHRLGLRDRVRFPGFVPYDDVPTLYHGADVFVMPSVIHASGDRDGIPTVIVEALAHRVPVVATDVSGIPELIEDGVTGRLVPPNDPTTLARAVRQLVRDRDAALALAARGRARALALFDPERSRQRILDLFCHVTSRS